MRTKNMLITKKKFTNSINFLPKRENLFSFFANFVWIYKKIQPNGSIRLKSHTYPQQNNINYKYQLFTIKFS